MTQTNIEPDSFGALLKAFRKRERLTQHQLGQVLGMNRNAISRWEQGDFLPASKTIVLELARSLRLNEQETRQLLEASLTALSPHWSVPFPRNLFFTGREEILDALHAQLGVDQTVARTQSFALYGLGGAGKTQIALEYAYRYTLEYSAVFWVGAETEEQIISSLLRIADVLGLPGRGDQEQQRVVKAVQSWLSTHSQWLLIWDNVEDLTLLDRFLLAARSGAILITTRRQALGTFAQGLDLFPMEREEGILFLLRRAKVLPADATSKQVQQWADQMPAQYRAVVELSEVMGGLPLALDQAGAYIEETRCSLLDYLQCYKRQQTQLLSRRGMVEGDHPHSVTATFLLSYQHVQQNYPAAADLLRLCALLYAEAIPEELVVAARFHSETTPEPIVSPFDSLDHLIAILQDLSLLQRHSYQHTLSIHRLVQVVLREQMGEQEQAWYREQIIIALNAIFPEVTLSAWGQCERLLPHVLLCTTGIPSLSDHQELADLLRKASDYLRECTQDRKAEPGSHLWQKPDDLDEALSLAKRALSIRSQALGADHPKAVATQELCAQSLQEQVAAEIEAIAQRRLEEFPRPPRAEWQTKEALHLPNNAVAPSSVENDALQPFLDACCELHPRAWSRSADLWEVYQQWIEEQQERYPLSRGAFIAQLKAHGCRADRTTAARIWRGIAVVKKEL